MPECHWDGCTYNTESQDELVKHTNIHTISSLICRWEGCKKRDPHSTKYTLQAHLRKHTGDRPFRCNECGKTYTRSDALNKHLKRHEKADLFNRELVFVINEFVCISERLSIMIREEKIKNETLTMNNQFIRKLIADKILIRAKNEVNGVKHVKSRNWDNYDTAFD